MFNFRTVLGCFVFKGAKCYVEWYEWYVETYEWYVVETYIKGISWKVFLNEDLYSKIWQSFKERSEIFSSFLLADEYYLDQLYEQLTLLAEKSL